MDVTRNLVICKLQLCVIIEEQTNIIESRQLRQRRHHNCFFSSSPSLSISLIDCHTIQLDRSASVKWGMVNSFDLVPRNHSLPSPTKNLADVACFCLVPWQFSSSFCLQCRQLCLSTVPNMPLMLRCLEFRNRLRLYRRHVISPSILLFVLSLLSNSPEPPKQLDRSLFISRLI